VNIVTHRPYCDCRERSRGGRALLNFIKIDSQDYGVQHNI
jgi:hypothetical protein